MVMHLGSVVSALGFTSGCVAIHALRAHAARLNGILVPVAIALMALVATVVLAQLTPSETLDLQGLDVEREISRPE